MARGRMLNKKISLSKAIAELEACCGCEGVLWFTWTIAHLDVEGRIHGDPDLLKATVCPRLSGITPETIRHAAGKAMELGLIDVYESDGDIYIEYPKFAENQVGLRKKREPESEIPPPSGIVPAIIRQSSGNHPESCRLKGREGKGTEGKGNKYLSSCETQPDRVDDGPPPMTPPKLTGTKSDVLDVFAHYRTHHPKAVPNPQPKSKEWRAIEARISEGFSVGDLCLAIDGCHRTPHNLGQNDRGQKYLGLELIMRNGDQVTRFIENATKFGSPAPPRTAFGRTAKRIMEWANGEDDQEGVRVLDGETTRALPERSRG